jgi:hypothetical protein
MSGHAADKKSNTPKIWAELHLEQYHVHIFSTFKLSENLDW